MITPTKSATRCRGCGELSASGRRRDVFCDECRRDHTRRSHAFKAMPCSHCGKPLTCEEPAGRGHEVHAFNLAIWGCAACRCTYQAEVTLKLLSRCGLEQRPIEGECRDCGDETILVACTWCGLSFRCLNCNAKHNEDFHVMKEGE